jgi:coenzyme Q-binding protein COQ10
LRHALTRILPYAPAQLFDLVGDVEAYPKFVRWVTDLTVANRRAAGDGISVMDAEAQVKFAFVRERFATTVRLDRPHLAIDVGLISGPFRRLENHWRFAAHPRGALLSFAIDAEFRGRLLNSLLAANFHTAAERLMICFEHRAAELYGVDACTG